MAPLGMPGRDNRCAMENMVLNHEMPHFYSDYIDDTPMIWSFIDSIIGDISIFYVFLVNDCGNFGLAENWTLGNLEIMTET